MQVAGQGSAPRMWIHEANDLNVDGEVSMELMTPDLLTLQKLVWCLLFASFRIDIA
jgi:hypothetical protein